jgi:hypothetical protein
MRQRINQARDWQMWVTSRSLLSLLPATAGLLVGLFFETEDGGNMFLQNIRLSLNWELQSTRPYSSTPLPENLKLNTSIYHQKNGKPRA